MQGPSDAKSCGKNAQSPPGFNYDKYPPPEPPPGGPDQWELQFCNWWGWSWLPKGKASCYVNAPTTVLQRKKKKFTQCCCCGCLCKCACWENFCPCLNCCCTDSSDEEELLVKKLQKDANLSCQSIPTPPSPIVQQPVAVERIKTEHYCGDYKNYQQLYRNPQYNYCCQCNELHQFYELPIPQDSDNCNKQTETVNACRSDEVQTMRLQENKSATADLPLPYSMSPPQLQMRSCNPGPGGVCCSCNPRPRPVPQTTNCSLGPGGVCCPCPMQPPQSCYPKTCPKFVPKKLSNNSNPIVNTCLVDYINPIYEDFLNFKNHSKIYKPLSLLIKNNMNLLKLNREKSDLHNFFDDIEGNKALGDINVCTNADRNHYKLLTSVCDAILTQKHKKKRKKDVKTDEESHDSTDNYYYLNSKLKSNSNIGVQVNNRRRMLQDKRPTVVHSSDDRKNGAAKSSARKSRDTTLRPPDMTKTGIYCQYFPSDRQLCKKSENLDDMCEKFLNSVDFNRNDKDLGETSPPFTDLESPLPSPPKQ